MHKLVVTTHASPGKHVTVMFILQVPQQRCQDRVCHRSDFAGFEFGLILILILILMYIVILQEGRHMAKEYLLAPAASLIVISVQPTARRSDSQRGCQKMKDEGVSRRIAIGRKRGRRSNWSE